MSMRHAFLVWSFAAIAHGGRWSIDAEWSGINETANLEVAAHVQFFLLEIYGSSNFTVAVGAPGLDSCARSVRDPENRYAVTPIVSSPNALPP